jgi:ATP-dependent Clp protease ATP-binding subunit ClpC
VGRLALQIYLLEAACAGVEAGAAWDAFVQVRVSEDGAGDAGADAHARKIAAMYKKWADRRRMQIRVLEESPPGSKQPFRWVAAISGYAALTFLSPEAGWHVLEVPENGSSFQRARVEVRVAPQPWEPQRTENDWRRAATLALDAVGLPSVVVRRYREAPSPLVRDSVRGWRTGRLDRVLAGEFDVMG